jgi:hypothetical protein
MLCLTQAGKLLASTKVWTVGMPDWRRLVDVKQLFSRLATVPFPSNEIKYTRSAPKFLEVMAPGLAPLAPQHRPSNPDSSAPRSRAAAAD